MGSTNQGKCFLSRSDRTLRSLCCSSLSREGSELTIGRHHIHPEPEAVLPMVVQRFGYMAERKTQVSTPD